MFAILLLLPIALAQDAGCTQNFVLTATDARRNTFDGDWEWDTSSLNSCTFEPGVEYTFTVDLSNLEGTNSLGQQVTIQGEEGVDLDLYETTGTTDLHNIEVNGFFNDNSDSWGQYSWRHTYTECDFGKRVHTWRMRNTASYTERVRVEIEVRNEHSTCELAAAVRAWLTAVLIILGICCGCGILIAVLATCGCIACCNQSKTTVHHTTVQTVAVPQQVGGGEMTPAQPTYGGPPGGTPDMTQYSAGLQPGWEAKWDVATNRPYWVDHNNQRSIWEDPRTNMGSA